MSDTERTGIEKRDSETGENSLRADQDVAIAIEKPAAVRTKGLAPVKSRQEAIDRVTPMMAQYTEIKTANPDCLLFYRMGDFYEMFFEDAEIASRTLGIVLTKRGKHLGEDIHL